MVHDNISSFIPGHCIYAPGDLTKTHHNTFHTITGDTMVFAGHDGIRAESCTFDGCTRPLPGWSLTTIQGNAGLKTEIPEGQISPPFAVDAIDTICVQFIRGLSVTPRIQQCRVFVVSDTAGYDCAVIPMVVSTDATFVGVKSVHEPLATPEVTAEMELVTG